MGKKARKKNKPRDSCLQFKDYLSKLSDELLCHIFSFLPFRDVVHLSLQNWKLHNAVQLYLHLCKIIDFTEGKLQAYMPVSISDNVLNKLLKTCCKVEKIYGLHPWQIEKRRQRNRKCLSIPGILESLSSCEHLKGVEISDLRLMGAILENLPNIEILGHFQNRDGQFPIPNNNFFLDLPPCPKITSLSLTGVEITELPPIPQLECLHLQWVRFSKPHPFRHFSAPKLETFILKNSAGPIDAARYVPLAVSLAKAPNLAHIEFVRVPFLGGLLQRVVEDHWHKNGFRKLKSIVIGACSHITESDIGFLTLASDNEIESLKLQPSLSKDSFMLSLKLTATRFINLRELYVGFIDEFPPKGSWTNEELQVEGLANVIEFPSPITDAGMKIICQIFPHLEVLTVNWSPNILQPTIWTLPDGSSWNHLQDLILKKCHCLKLEDFVQFLSLLPQIETVTLEDMFYAPPSGCSHVGLSAGTGLGMSSAVITNQQNPLDIAENENINPLNPAILEPENNFAQEVVQQDNNNNNDEMALQNEPQANEVIISNNQNKERNFETSENSSNCEKTFTPETKIVQNNGQVNSSPSSSSSNDMVHKDVDKLTARISEFDKPGTSGVKTLNCPNSFNSKGVKLVDRSCQVNANDFKQTGKPNTIPPSPSDSMHHTQDHTASKLKVGEARHHPVKGKNLKKKNKTSSKKTTHDRATSTSDPVFLEKTEQAIVIVSETLKSITFIACGVTAIEINHCPQLRNIQIDVCPIFQTVKLKSSLALSTLNISECPQADFPQIVDEVGKLPARRNRNVYIKTMDEIKDGLEKIIFEDRERSYHACILDNYYPASDDNILNKHCFVHWMKFFHDINYDLIKKWGFTQTDKSSSSSETYPWNKHIHRLNISCCDGDYDVVTDIPWLTELWVPPRNTWNCFHETLHPRVFGFDSYSDCYNQLRLCIAEQKELKCNLHLFILGIYIHKTIEANEA